MRIALCLSGQPRTWRATRASLAAFFARHDVEMFLHTWREGDPSELDALLDAYQPRAHKIEPRPLFLQEKRLLAERFPHRPPLTLFDMFHSMGESLALAADFGPYDLVVRARFDALFDGVWAGEPPTEGEVILPDAYPEAFGVNDQFAIGRPAEMQTCSRIVGWLQDLLPDVRGRWFRPEAALKVFLEDVSGLRVRREPIAMRLLREGQVGLAFGEAADDVLFHAAKHEAWEAFAAERFPDVAANADFDHPSRTPLALDRAFTAWLAGREAEDGVRLLAAPWPERIRAVDAFITGQAGALTALDEDSYQNVRLVCAMLLQRMDGREAMTPESYLVHALSANSSDMRRAADWSDRNPAALSSLAATRRGLGPLALAFDYAPALTQQGVGAWPARPE
jgi:hypothetical protein